MKLAKNTKTLVLCAATALVANIVYANASPFQEERPTPLHDKDQEKPGSKRDTAPCIVSDLTPTKVALSGTRISGSKLTLSFKGIIKNKSLCDARASRTKGVLTLKGGKWIGQSKFDHPAIPKRGSSVFEMSITFPYKDILVDDTITRSDWILTVTADWLKKVPEKNENNNETSFSFSTSSDKITPTSL